MSGEPAFPRVLSDEQIEEFLGELDGYCDRAEVVRKWFGGTAKPTSTGAEQGFPRVVGVKRLDIGGRQGDEVTILCEHAPSDDELAALFDRLRQEPGTDDAQRLQAHVEMESAAHAQPAAYIVHTFPGHVCCSKCTLPLTSQPRKPGQNHAIAWCGSATCELHDVRLVIEAQPVAVRKFEG